MTTKKNYKVILIIEKIKSIILSRRKKPNNEQWIEDRTRVCNTCPHNTANMKKISFKQRILRLFSNLLTLTMTGKFNDSDAECSICTCTLEFKIPTESETCDDNRWKSIYIPNSGQNKKWK